MIIALAKPKGKRQQAFCKASKLAWALRMTRPGDPDVVFSTLRSREEENEALGQQSQANKLRRASPPHHSTSHSTGLYHQHKDQRAKHPLCRTRSNKVACFDLGNKSLLRKFPFTQISGQNLGYVVRIFYKVFPGWNIPSNLQKPPNFLWNRQSPQNSNEKGLTVKITKQNKDIMINSWQIKSAKTSDSEITRKQVCLICLKKPEIQLASEEETLKIKEPWQVTQMEHRPVRAHTQIWV